MLKAYKYRIYPYKEQKIQMAKTFDCCRFVYNQTLAYRKHIKNFQRTCRIKSATISQAPSRKYFVSVLVETEHGELPHTEQEIGLDLGIKDFCITSGGEKYENPKTIKRFWLWVSKC